MDANGRPKGDHALQRVLITVGEVDKLLMLLKDGAAGVNKLLAARLTLAVSAMALMILSSSILKSFNILSLPDICNISKMIYQFGGIAM